MNTPPELTPQIRRQLDFANRFATDAGDYMRSQRWTEIEEGVHDDGTPTNSVAMRIDQEFKESVVRYFPDHAVIGLDSDIGAREEANDAWIINPMDAAEQFKFDTSTEGARISCAIGIGKMVANQLAFVVVYAPFKEDRYYAVNDHGAYVNGLKMQVGDQEVAPGTLVPYDYRSDPQSGIDFARLADWFGPPLGEPSVLLQACDVARGRSAFSAQATNGSNIGLGALIVQEAGGTSKSAPFDSLVVRPAIGVIHASPTAYSAAESVLTLPH